RDNTLKLWNWQSGEFIRTLEGHSSSVWSASLSGEFAVSASLDKTFKVWNWRTGELITTFYADAPLYCVAIADDFERIIAGGRSGNMHFLRPNATLLARLRGES
ncbi:MAG: hypothetical protein AAFN11_10210, partial [Chloroflexota bacterium]